MQAGVARQAHSHAQAAKRAAGAADLHGPPKGGSKSSGPRSRNANPIDTSITVLPRRASGTKSQSPYGKQGFRIAPVNSTQPHRSTAPFAGQGAPRNAIGVPVLPHQAAGTSHSSPLGVRILPRPFTPSTSGGLARTGGTIGATSHVGANGAPLVNLPGGRIGGAPLIRPVAAPPRIGGPSGVIGGINGTTFRRKN
jgi:hypothetical protein